MPSIRKFSKENQVSLVTVSKAYSLLERNGYIHLMHGKGLLFGRQKRGKQGKARVMIGS
ncbi:GntR family transcriptional regulator [Bacillus sp. PK3_68]|uniref:GntR family transcriptional regulator n=1 Tax=Bacillus sp. PK3_68 TaxID=2027408 RepID=UPI00217DBA96|nr:GntR family transcriptional regulator [Bacillus sp. PK3_68]